MGNMLSTNFAPECTELKENYDACFNKWYTDKFLTGKSVTNECTELWHEYKACVDAALIKKGIIPKIEEQKEPEPAAKADKK